VADIVSVAAVSLTGMSASTAAGPEEAALLDAATVGDDQAFRALLDPHKVALHLHCYRMLGSYHDAEEALQETLMRAWRHLGNYQREAPLRHWLYRIATNACLKIIEGRARRPSTVAEVDYLQPYPDRPLNALPVDADPAAALERRESVSLAFVTALQLLPATQRAVLILKDVLAWRAEEVAGQLGTSVAAVNSILQRARATLRKALPETTPRPLDAADQRVLARFVDAWHRRDIDGLAALLHEDVVLRMPPEDMEFRGRDEVLQFFAVAPAGGELERIRLVPTRANGRPALGAFLRLEDGSFEPYGLMVVDLDGDAIATVTGFPASPIRPSVPLPSLVDVYGVRPG
jgi:RNA polymerase sigma-70 factor, ECF subfamily